MNLKESVCDIQENMESQSPAKDNEFAATLIDMDYQRVMGYIISSK